MRAAVCAWRTVVESPESCQARRLLLEPEARDNVCLTISGCACVWIAAAISFVSHHSGGSSVGREPWQRLTYQESILYNVSTSCIPLTLSDKPCLDPSMPRRTSVSVSYTDDVPAGDDEARRISAAIDEQLRVRLTASYFGHYTDKMLR